jgi:aspartyl protease family protein
MNTERSFFDRRSARPITPIGAWAGASLIALALAANTAHAVSKINVIGLFKDKAIVEIDGQRRVLSTGNTSPEGVHLLSANSKEAIMAIDGVQRAYTLGSRIGNGFAPPASSSVSVRIWPNAAGMYFVNGNINQFPVKLLVDTGATLVAMNEREAKRLGLPYKLQGVIGQASTASGTTKAYYIRLSKVRVGEIELNDVEAAVLPGAFPTEVLLGNSFLSRLNMVRTGQVMELQSKN